MMLIHQIQNTLVGFIIHSLGSSECLISGSVASIGLSWLGNGFDGWKGPKTN